MFVNRIRHWFQRRRHYRRISRPSRFLKYRQTTARLVGHWWRSSGVLMRQVTHYPRRAARWMAVAIAVPLSFVRAWIKESGKYRRWRNLAWGAPAIVSLLVVVAFAEAARNSSRTLANEYRNAARIAVSRGEKAEAKMCLERLIDLEGPRQVNQFDLALLLDDMGEHERAAEMIRDLASFDRDGYDRAHLWFADRIMESPNVVRNTELLQLARKHLETAKQTMDLPDVHFRLSKCYAALQMHDAALASLARAAQTEPAYTFELYRLNQMLNRQPSAQQALLKADAYYGVRVRNSPDDVEARLRWADLRTSLGDYDGAVALLREGLAARPDGPFGPVLARIYVSKFQHLARTDNPDAAVLLSLLEEALKCDPDSVEALQEMSRFGIGQLDSEVQRTLEDLLARGKSPAMVHFVLAVRSWQTKDVDRATFHLERAYSLNSQMATVANNLAYLICFDEDPDLDRALLLVNSALSEFPEDPAYRDTRGQILLRQGRWKEALDDLEFALPHLPKNRQLHLGLEAAYRQLGQDSLADRHAEMAKAMNE